MIEPRSGIWWTDSDTTRCVPGTLTRLADSWRLDLIGTLTVYDTRPVDGLDRRTSSRAGAQ